MKEIACVALVCVIAALLFNVRSEVFWRRTIEAAKQAQDKESAEHVRKNIQKVYNEIPKSPETMEEWEARKKKEAEQVRFSI